jgi:hypothetical protein
VESGRGRVQSEDSARRLKRRQTMERRKFFKAIDRVVVPSPSKRRQIVEYFYFQSPTDEGSATFPG